MKLFDMHCDTLYNCYKDKSDLLKNAYHVDLERGKIYECWIQVFAMWTPDDPVADEIEKAAAFREAAAALAYIHKQEKKFPEALHIWKTREKLEDIIKEKGESDNKDKAKRKCTAVLALENGAALGYDIRNLNFFREMGVRIITLTWNGSNRLGHGCLSGNAEGLTDFGKDVVRQMEKSGMVPDVSHLNERGFWDAAELCRQPFIASHSMSAKIYNHPRNLQDSQILEIIRRGGLIGLNMAGEFMDAQTFEQAERHAHHIWTLGGESTLGIGFDLDGTEIPPEWKGIGAAALFAEYLYRKNYQPALLERLFFGNCYDFFNRL
ncbi:MAG: membrane dipeptidase [Oscillospiraceae bacterium]|nr:membrane dipeptidase [Oscillospiraceae bacterium]